MLHLLSELGKEDGQLSIALLRAPDPNPQE